MSAETTDRSNDEGYVQALRTLRGSYDEPDDNEPKSVLDIIFSLPDDVLVDIVGGN